MLVHSNFRILIVDDIPANLKLLAEILTEEGYQIGFAQDGKQALVAAENLLPDLILLDIMMPILDGYQTCIALKENVNTENIPVIFLTAKQDVLDITKAFDVGAVDYLTKPFNSAELLKRIHTHLLLANQNKKLQLQIEQLESLQKDLIQSEKVAAIGKLMAGISHGINTPLSVIKSFIDGMSEQIPFFLDRMMAFYQQTNSSEQAEFLTIIQQTFIKKEQKINKGRQIKKQLYKELVDEKFSVSEDLVDNLIYLNLHNNYKKFISLLKHEKREDIFELACMFVEWKRLTNNTMLATNRTVSLIHRLQQYAEQSMISEKTEVDIKKEILHVLELLDDSLEKKEIEVSLFLSKLPLIQGKEEDFFQIWYNLINNSIHAMSQKGVLKIKTSYDENKIIIQLSDTGQGIPSSLKDKIFDPFFTTNYSQDNVGFGLFYIKNTLEAYHGTIEIKSFKSPTIFEVIIPIN